MSLITAENLNKSYGHVEVIHSATFRVEEDDMIGLVGPNGEGKTTLIRLLAGLEEPTDGTILRRKHLHCGYLPQEVPALADTTLHQAMLEIFADLRQMEKDLKDLSASLETSHDEAVFKRFGAMQHEFESRGGYGYLNKIQTVLTGLGFDRSVWDRPLSEFSGGQRKRAYLGRLLLDDFDLLLLDEPTNHLDMDSIEWLEGWLASFKKAVIVVSHDRYFLDKLCRRTWEISRGRLETYHGAYGAYLVQRQQRYLERLRQWEAQQEYIQNTEEFIRIHIAGQRSNEAKGRRTRLERFLKTQAVERPREPQHIHVGFGEVQRSGDLVFRAEDLKVGYVPGQPLVSVTSLQALRGQRIGIVGANGCGKTTLVRTLLGQVTPLAGGVQMGAAVNVGYLSQTHDNLNGNWTVLQAVRSADPSLKEEQVRTLLGSLLLSGDDAFKLVKELSGGQRSRVVLAQLIVRHANVLVLDEPTNHLDIPSTEVLQDVLANFEGTVLFVSHDRFLIRSVATHIWAVRDGAVYCVQGNWDDYLRWRQSAGQSGDGAVDPLAAGRTQRKLDRDESRRQKNLVQRLQRKHEQLEEQIHQLEQSLKSLNERIAKASDDGDVPRIEKLGLEYQQADQTLQDCFAQWEQVGQELEDCQ